MSTNWTRDTSATPCTVSVGTVSLGMNDEDRLLSRLRAGEEGAFEVIVTHHQEMLTRMAMRYVANRSTAEEVVQETWITVMTGLTRFEGRSSLHAWICGILIHKAKDRGVREKRQRVFSEFELEPVTGNGDCDLAWVGQGAGWPESAAVFRQLSDDRTPEKLLASRQAINCMWQAIETLPTGQREVLMLRDVQGIETEQVCQQLKISETNLYVRLHRARARVKVAVETALG